MSALPYITQFRNGLICEYKDVSLLNIQRNGCIATLKQNQFSKYYDVYKSLNKLEDVKDIASYSQSVKKLKYLHDKNLWKQLAKNKIEKSLNYIDNKESEYYKELYKSKYKKLLDEGYNFKPVGLMSKQQIKQVRRCLENLVNYIYITHDKRVHYKQQQYATFVTLTLPSKQIHSDKVIRRLLVRLIDNLRKNYKVKYYVWKAETQGNGNIHFHLLLDRFIDYKKLRNLWNGLLNLLGYVDRYSKNQHKRGFVYRKNIIKSKKFVKNPVPRSEQLRRFEIEKANNFQNPNTTDIKSLKDKKSPIAYMLKYMTKNEKGKRPVVGKIWGASNELKKMEYFKIDDTNPMYWDFWSKIEKFKLKRIEVNEFLFLFQGKIFNILRKYFKKIWLSVKNHYRQYKNPKLIKKQIDKPKIQEYFKEIKIASVQLSFNLKYS